MSDEETEKTEETEEKEEKTEESSNDRGEEINQDEYRESGPKPGGGSEEEQKTGTESTGSGKQMSKSTADLFIELLSADLPDREKRQFQKSYKPIAEPAAEVMGVDDSYPNLMEKAQRLPWPVRMVLGGGILAGGGILIKSQITGKGFKEELQDTVSLNQQVNSSGRRRRKTGDSTQSNEKTDKDSESTESSWDQVD